MLSRALEPPNWYRAWSSLHTSTVPQAQRICEASSCGEEGTRQTNPYSLCEECAAGCSLRSSGTGGSGRSAAGSAGSRREEQGEEKRSHEHEHVDGMKDSLLEPRCVCARCDVLTHKKKLNSARSRSDNVEVSGTGHVVIGVRIVQCHHAIMDNCEHVVIGVRVMHCHHVFMANS